MDKCALKERKQNQYVLRHIHKIIHQMNQNIANATNKMYSNSLKIKVQLFF